MKKHHTIPVTFQTLEKRFLGVFDASLNCLEEEAAGHKTHLDELERYLFHTGRKAFHNHQLWLSRRSHIINPTSTAVLVGKRKHSQIS